MRNCQLLNNRFLGVSLDCLSSSVAPWTFVEVQSLIFDLLLLLLFIYLFIYFCACECLSEIVTFENFVCDQGPVSRKSRNFSGTFRVAEFFLYVQSEGVLRHETLQLF